MRAKVSIHAHQFHSGRHGPVGGGDTYCGFNPRPPISQRATICQRAVYLNRHVSIHAHQFHSGRLDRCLHCVATKLVSIHAHQFHSGRPRDAIPHTGSGAVSIHAHQFHSGRRPTSSTTPACKTRFNPRPPISQRATRSSGIAFSIACAFQSTPTNFTAGDVYGQAGTDDLEPFQSTPTNFTAGDGQQWT